MDWKDIGHHEVVAFEQQRRVVRFGQRVSKQITEIEPGWVPITFAKLGKPGVSKLGVIFTDRDNRDARLLNQGVEQRDHRIAAFAPGNHTRLYQGPRAYDDFVSSLEGRLASRTFGLA